MNKKIVTFIMGGLMGLSLVACNKDGNFVDSNVDSYVQLGQYTGMEVSVEAPTVDEEMVLDEMHSRLVLNIDKVAIKEGTCKNGDKVNIDYEGYVGDEQFEGGTASSQNCVLGSGQYIPGFEEGIVGMEVGEVKAVAVRFPDGYQAEDLAGKEAVFKITLNYIFPDLTDEVIAAWGKEEYSTKKELHDYIYNMYYDQAVEDKKNDAVGELVYMVVQNATFKELPQDLVEEQKQTINNQLGPYCQAYGTTVDEYLKVIKNTTVTDLANEYVKQRIALRAIAKAEGLEVSEATVNSTLESAAAGMGQTVDEYLEAQGVTVDYLKEYMISQLVYDYLYENNTVNEIEE